MCAFYCQLFLQSSVRPFPLGRRRLVCLLAARRSFSFLWQCHVGLISSRIRFSGGGATSGFSGAIPVRETQHGPIILGLAVWLFLRIARGVRPRGRCGPDNWNLKLAVGAMVVALGPACVGLCGSAGAAFGGRPLLLFIWGATGLWAAAPVGGPRWPFPGDSLALF